MLQDYGPTTLVDSSNLLITLTMYVREINMLPVKTRKPPMIQVGGGCAKREKESAPEVKKTSLLIVITSRKS